MLTNWIAERIKEANKDIESAKKALSDLPKGGDRSNLTATIDENSWLAAELTKLYNTSKCLSGMMYKRIWNMLNVPDSVAPFDGYERGQIMLWHDTIFASWPGEPEHDKALEELRNYATNAAKIRPIT